MPTCLLCAHCLICLFIHFLSLLHALVNMLGAFQVLHTAFCVFLRACFLFPSLMVVPGSLREVVGLSSKFPEVSQLAGLQGHDLFCACVPDPVLDAEPGKQQCSAAHQMGLWPPPRSLQSGWLRPVVSSQANIPRGKSGLLQSRSRAWQGRSVTPGTAQSGRGSLALSVDECLTQEETTGHRAIPDVPGSHPELFSSQKYPDLLQLACP